MRPPDPAAADDPRRSLPDVGAPSAVGGSVFLASLGLAEAMNDWDVLTDAWPRCNGHRALLEDCSNHRRKPGSVE